MRNADVIDLYERVKVGTKVVVMYPILVAIATAEIAAEINV
jgi:hypothetical protein